METEKKSVRSGASVTTTKKENGRKAIFVIESVFDRFKSMAEKDGRKYSAYLDTLLDGAEVIARVRQK